MRALYKIMAALIIAAAAFLPLMTGFAEESGGFLIIYGMSPDNPYSAAFSEGVHSASDGINVSSEFLYAEGESGGFNEDAVLAAVSSRISARPLPEAVIPADNYALRFVLCHIGELGLENVPIVLTAVTDTRLAGEVKNPIGEPLSINFDSIADIADRLLPEGMELSLVCGQSDFERGILTQYKGWAEHSSKKIESNTESAIDGAVLSAGVFDDPDSTDNPVFTVYDTLLGDGLLGGYVLSSGNIAECAVRCALGEEVHPNASLRIDHSAAERLGLELSSVPGNVKYINYHQSFKEKYGKKLAIASLVLIFLLFMLQLISRWIEFRSQNRRLYMSVASQKASMEMIGFRGAANTEYLREVSRRMHRGLAGIISGSAENAAKTAAELSDSISEFLSISSEADGDKPAEDDTVFSLNEFFGGLCTDFKKLCVNKDIKFSFVSEGLDDCEVFGDQVKLRMVTANLLYVAAAAAVGSITLETDYSPDDMLLTVAVTVSGGEAAERQSLGLIEDGGRSSIDFAMLQHNISMAGGKLCIESDNTECTIVRFSVPLMLKKVIQQAASELTKPLYSDVRIIVAEHNELNLAIVKEMLRATGTEPECVRDSRDAVYAFNKAHIGDIDLIMLDFNSPLMNGFDAANTIRKSRHANSATVPIVIMGAHGGRFELEAAQRVGVDAMLKRPIDEEELYDTLERLLPGRNQLL